MGDADKVKNIIVFLSIIFNGSADCLREISGFSPDYLIEKFERYVLSARPESDWGLHHSLRLSIFEPYCEKWGLTNED